MRRFVFQPRWILGHLLVLAAALACLWLGDWQWGRAHVTGSAQNWGYAFQWPLFAACFLIGWWRMLRLESLRLESLRLDEQSVEGGDDEPVAFAPVLAPPPVLAAPVLAPPVLAAPVLAPASGLVPAQPPGVPATAPQDEQLAAYNRMLAALAARDATRRR